MFICADCLSRILRTILSPCDEGNEDTLTSIFLSPRERDTLPSCGNLLSDISNPDIILSLDIKTDEILLSCVKTSFNMPSTLYLITI